MAHPLAFPAEHCRNRQPGGPDLGGRAWTIWYVLLRIEPEHDDDQWGIVAHLWGVDLRQC